MFIRIHLFFNHRALHPPLPDSCLVSKNKAMSRLDQLIDWCKRGSQGDSDCVIIFDGERNIPGFHLFPCHSSLSLSLSLSLLDAIVFWAQYHHSFACIARQSLDVQLHYQVDYLFLSQLILLFLSEIRATIITLSSAAHNTCNCCDYIQSVTRQKTPQRAGNPTSRHARLV